MPDKRLDKKHGSGAAVIAVSILFLTLYVASAGPANWMEVNGFISNDVLGWVYSPLLWVMDHCEPIRTAILWYCGLWAGLKTNA